MGGRRKRNEETRGNERGTKRTSGIRSVETNSTERRASTQTERERENSLAEAKRDTKSMEKGLERKRERNILSLRQTRDPELGGFQCGRREREREGQRERRGEW